MNFPTLTHFPQVLQKSDFSLLTRQSLGMSPYPKNIGSHKSSMPPKHKNAANVCRRSSQQDDDSEDDIIDVESIDPVDILLPRKKIGEKCKPTTAATSPDQKILPLWKTPMMQNSLRTASSIECDRLPSVSAWVSSREVRKKLHQVTFQIHTILRVVAVFLY